MVCREVRVKSSGVQGSRLCACEIRCEVLSENDVSSSEREDNYSLFLSA